MLEGIFDTAPEDDSEHREPGLVPDAGDILAGAPDEEIIAAAKKLRDADDGFKEAA